MEKSWFVKFLNGLGFYTNRQVIDLEPISLYIKSRNIKTPEQFREVIDKEWNELVKTAGEKPENC